MNKHFARDLQRLSDNVLRLTAAVEDALSGALGAILARDAERARRVVEGDDAIDEMEVQIEEEALKILALHTPVAGDLRFLIAVIKIDNDLERIADIASNIAKRTLDFEKHAPVEPPKGFEEMTTRARGMVRQAIHSLIGRDTEIARSVLEEDDAVDALDRRIIQDLENRLKNAVTEHVDPLLRWVGVVRNVERIADLATNVAEDLIYMVEGEIVRHKT